MNKLSTARLARSFALAVATVACAAPMASQAHNYDAAMDTCIDAFVASSLPKEQPIKVRKRELVGSPLGIHSRAYKVVLSAKGTDSGKYLARGTCIVDRSGRVVALNGKPFTQKLAAR